MNADKILAAIKALANKDVAAQSQRYFKTGKGEYGEGDIFLGIRVPVLRQTVKDYKDTSLSEIKKLLRSDYHEARLLALLLLVQQFSNADDVTREKIVTLYLKHTKYINNWDLVDSSAPRIIGAWLLDKDREILCHLAQSPLLWERRIAIMATAYFINNYQYKDTLELSLILLHDPEDLIHKAVGWMLREVGNRDLDTEERFLKKHYKKMPRTMLRYAIEKFSEPRRQDYLKGKV